ncbi:MAG: permease-like cell division protein FtsX [Chloroflexota bacterium]|nr:permease-like cell division protein FtsX [Chloroflexota bacterium]
MHFLRFSFQQAAQGLWRNRVMNIAATVTMVLMLVMLSALVIIINGVESGLSYVESKVEVRAELHDGLLEERVLEFQDRLAGMSTVATINYVSKEDALANFQAKRADQGQQDITGLYTEFNPFYAYFAIELSDPRESRELVAALEAETGLVRAVLGQQTGIDKLVGLTSQLRNLGVIVLSFAGLTVLLIVINSIRMALMSRAQEIEIMRLVGASDRYVRWPFVLEGVIIGLLGAVITLLLLLVASGPISDLASDIAGSVPLGFDESLTLQIIAIVMGAGLGLGGVGAWISVRTYLR